MPLTFLGAVTFSCWAAARRRMKGKSEKIHVSYVFSPLLSTHAMGTLCSVGVTGFCAVCIEDAQCVGWLPRPPLTVLILGAKLVAGLSIWPMFKIDRILLESKNFFK